MSQHIAQLECEKVGGHVRVQLGWDKPLAEFYLVVIAESDAQCDNEEGIVYSNLDDLHSRGQELDYFKAIASNLGFEVPDAMWRAAYQDREVNAVNKTVFYSPDGEVVDSYWRPYPHAH